MLLNNLENNKVLFIVLTLVLILALFVIAFQVLEASHLSPFTSNIFEIAGEANCSGCVSNG